MSGLLLRLAAPLQSWGERSAFTLRDSAAVPTRSALIGMFAAALGRDRSHDPRVFAPLEFTVRIDRPGTLYRDFHTVGGGLEKSRTLATSGGKHKGSAVISERHYLADAVFVVAVTGPDTDVDRIGNALERPHWAPYLGRRSCPPDEPLVLRASVPDPIHELRQAVPLSYEGSRREAKGETVRVAFLWERPQETSSGEASVTDMADVPESCSPQGRRFNLRRVYRTVENLPAGLCVRRGTLVDRLADYSLGGAG